MIELKNVTKTYAEGNQGLADVNLQIDKGEFVFIVGGSGAGKTTLLKLLIGEDKPTSGSIRVAEQALETIKRRQIPEYRRKIGIVFRDFRLFTDKTVYENVAFALRVTGEPSGSIRTKVMTSLQMVELSDKVKCYPEELTGCEQQRVALARALAGGPNVIIADEPCGNIDPVESRDLLELFGRIQSRYEKTVVVMTHDKELAESFEHRIVRLHRGAVVEDLGAPSSEELLSVQEPAAEPEEATAVETSAEVPSSAPALSVTMPEPSLPAAEAVSPFPELPMKSATSDTIEYDLSALIASGEMDAQTASDLAIATMQMLDLPELDAQLIDAVAKKMKKKEGDRQAVAMPNLSALAEFEPVLQETLPDSEQLSDEEDSPTVTIPIVASAVESSVDETATMPAESEKTERDSMQQTIEVPVASPLAAIDSALPAEAAATSEERVAEADDSPTVMIPAIDSDILLPEKEGDD